MADHEMRRDRKEQVAAGSPSASGAAAAGGTSASGAAAAGVPSASGAAAAGAPSASWAVDYEAVTPDMAQVLERRSQKNLFAKLLGVKVTEVRRGYAKCELEIREEFYNPSKVVHGGCIYTLADVAMGNAAAAYGNSALTLEASMHYLAAVRNVQTLWAEAKEIHHGRTAMVFEVIVTDERGKVYASGTSTFINSGRPFSFDA